MTSEMRVKLLVAVAALLMSMLTAYAVVQGQSDSLATPESFASIGDTAQRSVALFTELGKVLTHPRCVNCHPAGDRPRQGEMGRPAPAAGRARRGRSWPRRPCAARSATRRPTSSPAACRAIPEWHLAPREMAWEGKTLGEICVQIKDPERNGGRSLEDLIHHIGNDTLVGWAWAPGYGRQPAPGTQKEAGALVEAWVKTGAVCPN